MENGSESRCLRFDQSDFHYAPSCCDTLPADIILLLITRSPQKQEIVYRLCPLKVPAAPYSAFITREKIDNLACEVGKMQSLSFVQFLQAISANSESKILAVVAVLKWTPAVVGTARHNRSITQKSTDEINYVDLRWSYPYFRIYLGSCDNRNACQEENHELRSAGRLCCTVGYHCGHVKRFQHYERHS